ncbi:ADP compounds hydrolase NudE [Thiohalomonas denitrificans]|uniref:ADP-ribose diphosphatase n=1 Tax=Thiohalomonas denitrificans TaxID=415747 RepID=A0A1G5R0K4_9GAMM|nr:ADP compounds hydrolase NudE [Thiohalomonas denitrificans]SCZ67496.1 ADP-ribose diphosphatase [Thiohalomonas denitrificans]
MREKPRILDIRTLARTRLFHVQQLELRFANGVETTYERLLGSPQGAVLVVPLLEDRQVLLIREYAAGTDRYELALPKGRIETGEGAIEAANREIQEEIGYGANHLRQITSLTVAPGYLGHSTHVVLATDLYPQRMPGDEPEPIDVIPWSLDNLVELTAREDFTEARSIAALYMVRELLDG